MRLLYAAYSALCLATLAGCGIAPNEDQFASRGRPESLLDHSTEVVTLGISSTAERRELTDWIARDKPSRAQLTCTATEKSCNEAKKILTARGVSIVPASNATPKPEVTLVYERVTARDCDPRFVDTQANFYNVNSTNFGCSVAANIVQHVSDKKQFTAPNKLDPAPATRAVNDIGRAYAPRPIVDPYTVEQSAVSAASSE